MRWIYAVADAIAVVALDLIFVPIGPMRQQLQPEYLIQSMHLYLMMWLLLYFDFAVVDFADSEQPIGTVVAKSLGFGPLRPASLDWMRVGQADAKLVCWKEQPLQRIAVA